MEISAANATANLSFRTNATGKAMTSGSFHTLEISSILVDRASRNRRLLDGAAVAALSDSIRRIGLIHPPVVTRDGVLVAGETRLEAAKALGWTSIPVQFADEVDTATLRAIELEENIKRSSLEWQDECRAVQEFHDLQKAADPKWTRERTGEALGLGRNVEKYLEVANGLATNPRVADAQKFSTALGIVRRTNERAIADEAAAFLGEPAAPQDEVVLNEDFNLWAPAYRGRPFNLLHCDFPYGINIDKMGTGSSTVNMDTHGRYDDSPEVYWRLCNTLIANRERLLGGSAHIIFWFSMQHYSTTYDLLSQVFYVDPYPLLWHKSDNKGTYVGYERRARRVYESAFFCSLGDRKIISQVSNLIGCATDRTRHATAKPTEVILHFFRMVCDGNTRLLDPTCGSGTALIAGESLGAERVCGLEINPDFVKDTRAELAKRRQKCGSK